MEIDKNHVYEPINEYRSLYKNLHQENTTRYFDELVQKSNINVEENRQTIQKINKKQNSIDKLNKSLGKNKIFRTISIVLIVIGIISFVLGIYGLIQKTNNLLYSLLLVFGFLFAVGFFLLVFLKLNKDIKNLEEKKEILTKEYNELVQLSWMQMQPLNKLFNTGIREYLLEKTIPILDLDTHFNSSRIDYLVNNFGLNIDEDINRSTLFVQSGQINGNPFYIANDLVHEMGQKTYTGSITISWTVYVNGKPQTRTQTLTASVNKPCPYYSEQRYIVYANEAAPKLSFFRKPNEIHNLSESKYKKFISSKESEFKKLEIKALDQGKTFTTLGNTEFEGAFGAKNRDNEVEFRLLFTPLAQSQMIKILRDNEIGYGDDFFYEKIRKINVIAPKHLHNIQFRIDKKYYHSNDYDKMKKFFIEDNNNYFKQIYFTFAPILAIPLYQQQKPHEYIYKNIYKSNVAYYEHEVIANMLDINQLKNKLSRTENILKTEVIESKNDMDKIKVTAYGYKTVDRVDYINRLGGDGGMHTIPVRWVEYIPVQNETIVEANIIRDNKDESYQEKVRKLVQNIVENHDPSKIILISSLIARIL